MTAEPAPWIGRFAGRVVPGGTVLDLACGGGRHAALFAARGHGVTGVDRDLSALPADLTIERIEADLEAGPWPLAGRVFDAVVVVNYLWRPLLPRILAAVAPGGLLLHETFAVGQEMLGRPRNPDFLLRERELLEAVRGPWDVLAFEQGLRPGPAMKQSLAARRQMRFSSTSSALGCGRA